MNWTRINIYCELDPSKHLLSIGPLETNFSESLFQIPAMRTLINMYYELLFVKLSIYVVLIIPRHRIGLLLALGFGLHNQALSMYAIHDDVIKGKHFPRNWSFVLGFHRSPVNSPHNDQWRGALMFSLICAWINDWVNNREAGDLRRHRAHYDVIVMI